MHVILDAVGEWWIHPLATHLSTPYPRTVAGAISSTGMVLACELNHSAGGVRRYEVARAGVDDHNVPALWAMDDHRPVLVWTNHNADPLLRVKVGNRAGDLGSLVKAPETSCDLEAPASYAQIHRIAHLSDVGQDTLWVFTRRGNSRWVIQPLTVYQESGAVRFGDRLDLLDAPGRQAYITTAEAHASEGNQVIRLAWGYNPAQPVHAVRYIEIDCVNGDVMTPVDRAFRVNLAEFEGDAWIRDDDVPTFLPELDDGYSRRLFAVRPGPDRPAIAYAEWSRAEPDNAEYLVTALDGDAIIEGKRTLRTHRLGTSGARVGYTADANYIAGLAFENPSRDGAVLRAASDGTTETIARLRLAADRFSSETLVSQPTSNGRLIRPTTPLNGGPVAVIATEITAYDGYTDYQGNLMVIPDGH